MRSMIALIPSMMGMIFIHLRNQPIQKPAC